MSFSLQKIDNFLGKSKLYFWTKNDFKHISDRLIGVTGVMALPQDVPEVKAHIAEVVEEEANPLQIHVVLPRNAGFLFPIFPSK